jgi:hypothetical protein
MQNAAIQKSDTFYVEFLHIVLGDTGYLLSMVLLVNYRSPAASSMGQHGVADYRPSASVCLTVSPHY